MLRKAVLPFISRHLTLQSSSLQIRSLCSTSSSSNNDDDSSDAKKQPFKNVLNKEVIEAATSAAQTVANNVDGAKRVKNSLLSRLVKIEKQSFEAATESSVQELQADQSISKLLSEVAADAKAQKRLPNRFAAERHARRGLALLRKEIFYQAKQEGYSANDAATIAEKAVHEAEQKLAAKREHEYSTAKEAIIEESKAEAERSDKERKLFDYAFQMAEKMLYTEDVTKLIKVQRIDPDPNVPSLLNYTERLNVFNPAMPYQSVSLRFWREWDLRAAKIANQSMGPTNAIEEQIEWTSQGKLWPYPINNELELGEEESVSFIEHVFLERHLEKLGLPRNGPIGNFMHLVCVGLSKNPYMTAAKKRSHLTWFANYFNEEKTALIEKLHKQELEADS